MQFKKLTVIALVIFVSGCDLLTRQNTPTEGSETEREACIAWGESLPTRSRADTQATIDQITSLYATFAAACPDHTALIP